MTMRIVTTVVGLFLLSAISINGVSPIIPTCSQSSNCVPG